MPPPGHEPEISILDARLAEIDRRLHSIQTGLVANETPPPPPIAVPGDGPRTSPPPLPPADAHSAAELFIRLREVTAQQEGVLASMRQLLGTLQRVAAPPAAGPASTGPPAATAAGGATLSVSAGPFASTEALRSFRAALEALPGVHTVELRGFEGGDRAILEVHL
jgi:hypothetical protein